MLEYIKSICFFIIITTVLLNIFPNERYVKYIRIVIGFILILIVVSPLINPKNIIDSDKLFLDLQLEEETLSERIMEYENIINKRIENMTEIESVGK